MHLTEYQGDLFMAQTQTVVNTVNTVGVMGKGIALQFKIRYPKMFIKYKKFCDDNTFHTGQLWLYKCPDGKPDVLNFPTKQHWRNPSKLEWIEQGLKNFKNTYEQRGITSITFPALGCSNGQLDYRTQVKPLMFKYLDKLNIDVKIVLKTN